MIKNVKKIISIVSGEWSNCELTYDDNSFCYVPLNEDNRHYQEILQWVADGNTIQEAD